MDKFQTDFLRLRVQPKLVNLEQAFMVVKNHAWKLWVADIEHRSSAKSKSSSCSNHTNHCWKELDGGFCCQVTS
ncbi:hypothetical protein ACROYT_G010776 [Oculina patagonica]